MNFVTEITTDMVEAGMIGEHAPMLLHQSMTDELPGHSSDKAQFHPIVGTKYICAAYAMEQQCINIIAQMAGLDKTTPIPVCSKHHIVSGGCDKQSTAIDAAVKGSAPLHESNIATMHIGHSGFKCPRPHSCLDIDCGWNKTNLTVQQHDTDQCRGPKDLICPPCDNAFTLDGCSIADCHLMHGSTKKSRGTFGEWENKVHDTVPKPECKCI